MLFFHIPLNRYVVIELKLGKIGSRDSRRSAPVSSASSSVMPTS